MTRPTCAPPSQDGMWATFRLAGEVLALRVEDVQEVLMVQPLTPVPLAPAHIVGLLNLRGSIMPAIDLRRRLPQLRRRHWLTGELTATGQPDVVWWHPAGRPMRVADWQSRKLASLAVELGAEPGSTDGAGARTLLCLLNRDEIPVSFILPEGTWLQLCESSARQPFAGARHEKTSVVPARSVQLLSLEQA